MLVAGIILGIVGLLFLVGACRVLLRRKSLDEAALEADGTVTGLEDRGSGKFPIVTFTPRDARDAVTFSSSYTTNDYVLGQRLRVFYEPGDPESATLMSPVDSGTMARSLAIGGLVLLGLGALFGLVI